MFDDFFPAIVSLAVLAAVFLYAYLSDPNTNPNAASESDAIQITEDETETSTYGEAPELS